MTAPHRTTPAGRPALMARRLVAALASHRIRVQMYGAMDGRALVSVYPDLVVVCDGQLYQWWTGRESESGRPVMAYGHAASVASTARRVMARREELRRRWPVVASLGEDLSWVA
ncbi:hypothetical protein [Bailinhaonella thermotolerans]|uniref:Uncharacterized protein n=1 Tax=Bailinhaonella thermotolerans TaxID=1070861 RepID=A0A3A4A0K0_9ACTN|nr:hypothetical protein [Bailinhaonella thermotolerans]RJL19729.1 hypothetical protein D5H75_40090 [Bailinhaonella thermotolerans]